MNYSLKAKELKAVISEISNLYEYVIINEGYWYHRTTNHPLTHDWRLYGNQSICVECGREVEKRLKLTIF